jgi:hypothetical protein
MEMMMNGFDIQSALEVANTLRSMQRRAHNFAHDRDRILTEIGYMAENYEKLAERIEKLMEEEAA